MEAIKSISEFNALVESNIGVVAYFSTNACNVCKVLKPKMKELLEERFPNMVFAYVSMDETPEINGQYAIFSAPTIVVFFEGKEFYRASRNLSLVEFAQMLGKPYSLIFD